jgi:SAM-dependent MidA family methyltransferase
MSSDSYSQRLHQSASDTKKLPAPDALAQQHSESLIARIKTEIEQNGGSISFQRYMELTLYAPGLGYYAAGSTKFGEEGDFITAPEISSLFSRALAKAILPALAPELNQEFIILEVGAGRGRMAADILVYLQQANRLPKEYWILELSADLRQRQKQTIEELAPELLDRVKWLDQLPETFSGVVLANELLDAMPVQLFQKNEKNINEVNVVWLNDRFCFEIKSSFDQRLIQRVKGIETELGIEFETGYVSEINFAAEDWLKSIAERLQQGMIILIDYGFPRHEYYHQQRNQGTLMCHYRHRSHTDAFVYPGLQDITAHVDFTALADAAIDVNMQVMGYTNQVSFLIGAGLLQLAEADHTHEDVDDNIEQQMKVATEIKKLTLPHEMGELFKVIGFSKNCDVSLPAFEFRDMRDSL